MISSIKNIFSSALLMALFMLGSVMAPSEAHAENKAKVNSLTSIAHNKTIKTQFKDNKKPSLGNDSKNEKAIKKPRSLENQPKLRWNVKAQPLDSEALLQDNTFITDSDIDSFPFMQYDTEETSYSGNSRSSELERMQFTLTSQIEGHNRESAISLVSGSYAKKQEQNDKSQIVGGQGLAGVSNKATFLHACDKTQQTFNIKKIKFFVSCETLR